MSQFLNNEHRYNVWYDNKSNKFINYDQICKVKNNDDLILYCILDNSFIKNDDHMNEILKELNTIDMKNISAYDFFKHVNKYWK
jgi:hypothetical protein